jgi:hypothetical protein
MKSFNMDLKNHNKHQWTDLLIEFYDFVEDSREFLKVFEMDESSLELISELENKIEVINESSTGTQYKESKFNSAIYQDIDQLLRLKAFLNKYTDVQLRNFQKIIELELNGLKEDLNPRIILVSSLAGSIIIGLGLFATWSAIWANYFEFDLIEIMGEVLASRLKSISWLRWPASIVFVIGGFVGIAWYITASYKNSKQISFLSSLNRAISLSLLFNKDN